MLQEIALDQILPNPEQPRQVFDPQALEELAASIRENGVIQPIAVEEAGGQYIIHDGERRWRASRLAGKSSIWAIVAPPLNGTARQERLTRAMVANIQRRDLNPIEEARAYQKLNNLGLSAIKIALRLGINQKAVYDRLKLLELEEPIQQLVLDEKLSHDARLVKALLDLPAGEVRIKTAKTLAERRATIKAGIEACARVKVAVRAQTIPENETPAIRLAVKRHGELNRPRWDALTQLGKTPPWALVEICTRQVCDGCGLRDVANQTTCRDCALVELLGKMIGRTSS